MNLCQLFLCRDENFLVEMRFFSQGWKHDDLTMTNSLYMSLKKVWATQNVPQDWKNASIVPLFKKMTTKNMATNERALFYQLLARLFFL